MRASNSITKMMISSLSQQPSINGASVSAPKLQCSICNAESTRGTLKISFFLIGDAANSDILGRATDFLQSRSQTHRALDWPFKMQVHPAILARIANRTLLGRNATDGKRSLPGVPIGESQYGLLKIAHVARIFSMKQVIADCLIELQDSAVGTSLSQEMLG